VRPSHSQFEERMYTCHLCLPCRESTPSQEHYDQVALTRTAADQRTDHGARYLIASSDWQADFGCFTRNRSIADQNQLIPQKKTGEDGLEFLVERSHRTPDVKRLSRNLASVIRRFPTDVSLSSHRYTISMLHTWQTICF
jgi:hypothetical protein